MSFWNRIKWNSVEDITCRINKALDGLPQSTKEILLDRVVAKHLPKKSIGYKPYGLHPKSIYKGKVPYGAASHGNLESER